MKYNREQIEKNCEFTLDVIKRYDHYLATVNVKAGMLLSFLGVVLIVLINAWNKYSNPSTCFSGAIIMILFFINIALCLASVYKVASIVYPNRGQASKSSSVVFYGSVSKMSIENFKGKIFQLEAHEQLDDLALQAHELAIILDKKFEDLSQAVHFIKLYVLPSAALLITILVLG